MEDGELSDGMTTTKAHEQTRILVQAAAAVCEDKKGADTRILELDAIDSGLADFFLVTSVTSDRQAIAIADEIEFRLKRDFGVYAHSVEGRRRGEWVLLDYVDFVVHVFQTERRAFYDIERLRKSARPITPAEFDEELKDALARKTKAARGKTAAKKAAKAPARAATKTALKTAKATPAKASSAAAKKIAAKPAAKTAVKKAAKTAAKKTAKVPARAAAKTALKTAKAAPAKAKPAKAKPGSTKTAKAGKAKRSS